VIVARALTLAEDGLPALPNISLTGGESPASPLTLDPSSEDAVEIIDARMLKSGLDLVQSLVAAKRRS
jgi:hypothetical protein